MARTTIVIPVTAIRLPASTEGADPTPCPRCQIPLEFHQPDENTPDRLLATCEHCDAWFYVASGVKEGEAVLVHLPTPERILAEVSALAPDRDP